MEVVGVVVVMLEVVVMEVVMEAVVVLVLVVGMWRCLQCSVLHRHHKVLSWLSAPCRCVQSAAELVVTQEDEAGRRGPQRRDHSHAPAVGQGLEPAAHERPRPGGRVSGDG